MSEVAVFLAFLAFVLFMVAGKFANYAAIAGWTCIVLNLFLELPAFVAEVNFFYPALALLSIPFLVITVRKLRENNPVVLRLSKSAAVATILYLPFALIPVLHDALITVVINLVASLLAALGHQPTFVAWDIIAANGFYNQIILGCTGILAIALMLGIVAGVPDATRREQALAVLIIVPTLFLLNILRVAGVFAAVSGHWFAGFPDPTGTGDANFFWAHNVIAEALAILFLLVFLAGLSRILPGLYGYARDVVRIYYGDIAERIWRSGRA
jgi:archaeosortase A (PGF-CTERM-specific)